MFQPVGKVERQEFLQHVEKAIGEEAASALTHLLLDGKGVEMELQVYSPGLAREISAIEFTLKFDEKRIANLDKTQQAALCALMGKSPEKGQARLEIAKTIHGGIDLQRKAIWFDRECLKGTVSGLGNYEIREITVKKKETESQIVISEMGKDHLTERTHTASAKTFQSAFEGVRWK